MGRTGAPTIDAGPTHETEGDVVLMDMTNRGPLLDTQKKMLAEVQRTNELLEQVLAELRHANELTRYQQSLPAKP